jgi:glycosyltransferase involved in cell wall biosynthesis
MHVSICIATCYRPKLLSRLLINLSTLTFRKAPCPEITIVVVDNDARGSAEEVCRQALLPWPLTYLIEPKRGIPSARNRALRHSSDADCIALIDDDEAPHSMWLDELLWTQSTFAADVVSGPVIPVFAEGVPDWIKRTGFFNRPIYSSGTLLSVCSSNNTLISKRVIHNIPTFDEQFRLTGADDTHYFTKVNRAGFKIVSSSDAIVFEAIDRDRANLSNLMMRSYRGGNAYALVEWSLDKRLSTRMKRIVKGCGRIVQGLGGMIISPVRGMVPTVRAMSRIWQGFGMLTASVVGSVYEQYETVKGQ